MSNAIKLLKLDLSILFEEKIILLLPFIYIIIAIFLPSSAMLLALLYQNLWINAERRGSINGRPYNLSVTLPLTRKEIILSTYIYNLLFSPLSIFIIFLGNSLLFKGSSILILTLFQSLIVFSYIAVSIPISIKLKSKHKFIGNIVTAFPFLLVIWLNLFSFNSLANINPYLLILVTLFFNITIMLLSYLISQKIFKRLDISDI